MRIRFRWPRNRVRKCGGWRPASNGGFRRRKPQYINCHCSGQPKPLSVNGPKANGEGAAWGKNAQAGGGLPQLCDGGRKRAPPLRRAQTSERRVSEDSSSIPQRPRRCSRKNVLRLERTGATVSHLRTPQSRAHPDDFTPRGACGIRGDVLPASKSDCGAVDDSDGDRAAALQLNG